MTEPKPVTFVECAHITTTARKRPGHGWKTIRTISKDDQHATGSAQFCGDRLTQTRSFDAELVQAAAGKPARQAIRAFYAGKRVLRPGVHGWKTTAYTVTCTLTGSGRVAECGKPHRLASSTSTLRVTKSGDITEERTVAVDPNGVRMVSTRLVSR